MLDIPAPTFYAPTENDLSNGEEALKFNKLARLSEYHVRIFNMSDPKDVSEYEELMPKLFLGVQARNTVIWAKDRSLIDGTWKIYIEWSVYSTNSNDEKENEKAV